MFPPIIPLRFNHRSIVRPRSPVAAGARVVACVLVSAAAAFAIGQMRYVESSASADSFSIVENKSAAAVWVDANDHAGVVRAAHDLQSDIARVSGITPTLAYDAKAAGRNVILVGTVGKSAVIDQLVRDRKIEVAALSGKWESFIIQVVNDPMPGIARALVIAGSDKRGTIYGIYDLSEQLGVSPWYWWADVPVVHKDALFVKAGRYVQGPPSVKYRGIILNDEATDLKIWIREK